MFKINCHPINEYISDNIRQYGVWEKYCSEVMLELIKKENNLMFIDIGANIGYFSLLMASNSIECLSFEPIDENYLLFEKSIAENNFTNIKLFKVGLGESDCEKKFYIFPNNMGMCSSENKTIKDEKHSRIISIKPIDSYIELINKPSIVKIDVEEAELYVLKGMEKVLSSGKVKYLILEISKYNDELFDILNRHGYTTVVNIGFDPQNSSNPSNISCHKIENSSYLQNENYFFSIFSLRETLKKTFIQSNILFIRDNTIDPPQN
jgi:FkbM family methyltransferase